MSTIDLTKVAGFKAVDAEGNDMGIVSLSEMTNMVKESIIQEAVAMQSVSTLAETSTLAATDTYEDKLDISDTFSYVRTLDSSGNPKRTSQNALATVVGGLIGPATNEKNGLAPKGLTPYEYNKPGKMVMKLSINTTSAGDVHSSILTICGVDGSSFGIYLVVNKWNETKVSAKVICGSTSLGGSRLYYVIESNGNVSIYVKNNAYLRFYLSPLNCSFNPTISTLSTLPSEATEITVS